ncbi:DUF1289 domain-containing protein [Methylovirgula sp. 4M-Z18]|uniref:DUF1289 domain-containing protein n=1 Tax=Methylovirgula sp. 4M-Z18 TaxID=2293567 RepID=UPI000E2EA36A|nr:DUF1289 domain-containing protein [Methylovirgula sp. 4M-Z18]RFB80582.1 DUF1289 domain-containing protein [Methylovirgula sp. 4M-Z18]
MTVSTPCIKICVMEPSLGLCIGCGRSIAEISQWGLMSEETRLAIMAELPPRLERLKTRGGTPARVRPSERRRQRMQTGD